MDTGLIVDSAVAICALVIYACAGVAELGGTAVTSRRIHSLQEEIRTGKRTTASLIEASRERAASLEAVRIVMAVLAVVAIADAISRLATDLHWAIDLVILLVLMLLTGIGWPRVFLAAAPESWIETLAGYGVSVARLFRPFLQLADLLAIPFRVILPGREPGVIASEDEIRNAAWRDDADEQLQEAEQEMIDGVLRLEDMVASEIMVPRVDLVAVSASMPLKQILQKITATGHSRIPVYDQSIDDLLGVLHAKDLLPFLMREQQAIDLRRLVRPVYAVPESKRVDELLRDMRRDNNQVAIVADEYGGTAGLVTIEDIMEVIVGDIRDEYDVEDEEMVVVGPDELLADGAVSMEEIAYELDIDPDDDEEDYDTVGGFVLKYLERFPLPGDVVEAQGLRVEVLDVERHRVRRVRITRMPPPIDDSATGTRSGDE